MPLITNRIIFSDNDVLSDISSQLNNIESQTSVIPVIALEDYLYVGSDLPFNHRYFSVGVSNVNSSNVSVEVWNGNNWIDAVDVLDQTKVTGSTLSKSGIISWSLDQTDSWSIGNTEDITGLETLKIFDLYWARISFSADLSTTTSLRYIGHKFAEDEDIGVYYPELVLSETLNQFKSGKTTWEEQLVSASETIIRKLKLMKVIISGSQLLSWDLFTEACVHKTAEIAFNAFGDDYKDNKSESIKDYHRALKMESFHADRNKDLKVDDYEKFTPARVVRR